MTSPADIVRQILVDLGYVEESGSTWPVFASFFPDMPHQAVCIYDTAGRPDGRLMEDGTRIEHLGIQIRVRGMDYRETWLKANQLALILDTMGQILVTVMVGEEAYVVHNISRTGTIMPMGVDELEKRRRHYFSINAVVTIPNLEDYTVRVTHDGNLRVTEFGSYRILN